MGDTGKVGGKREGKKLENINIVLIYEILRKLKKIKLKRSKIISIFVTCLVPVFKFIQNLIRLKLEMIFL